ncbi:MULTISPECIES: hypothetical protein [Planktothricoides]|uniref:Uncharacterized protein n=2 Tax=Planktothricoides raciborskii TaxID=132608 RepID=A0AAU8JB58_9CYAN|nr:MULTISPECIES: hypothetical protein [Planktothricoides]MBD2547174.1 hypothetical protein [Planktothricoides raciborskii FACHB-1370]MBD2583401.1 hypothetical protein [Planktothricoides raciborskii FACHB-1261]
MIQCPLSETGHFYVSKSIICGDRDRPLAFLFNQETQTILSPTRRENFSINLCKLTVQSQEKFPQKRFSMMSTTDWPNFK